MDRWSVALFGHHKHRYELREKEAILKRMPMGNNYRGVMQHRDELVHKVVGRFVEMPTGFNEDKLFVYHVTGWEKRAVPGDVVAIRPWSERGRWTPHERHRFLIVTIDGPRQNQLAGLIEPVFDLNSYTEYLPESFVDFDAKLLLHTHKAKNKARALQGYEKMDRTAYYNDYLKGAKEASAFPRQHLNKRRFRIELPHLESIGVDIGQMLDTGQLYSPELSDIQLVDCVDKLKQRHVRTSDNLRTIQPRTFD